MQSKETIKRVTGSALITFFMDSKGKKCVNGIVNETKERVYKSASNLFYLDKCSGSVY